MPPREPVTGPARGPAPDPVHPADRGPRPEPTAGADASDSPLPPIVDWTATFRRFRRGLALVAAGVLVVWLALTVAGGGADLRLLGELVGFGLLVAFVVEVVVIGGAAVRGLLIAGERGERLARPDVSLLPPQLRRGGCGGGGCATEASPRASDGQR